MLRGILIRALAAALALAPASTARAVDDPRFAADFVRGLRERGYYDLALEYLDQLRRSPDAPADLKKTIEFEEGRTLIEAATHASDPDASKEKLDQAKLKIEAFVRAYPDLPETTEALVELAHLLYERGLTEVDLAGDARNASEKDNKLAVARGLLRQCPRRLHQGVRAADLKARHLLHHVRRAPERSSASGSGIR